MEKSGSIPLKALPVPPKRLRQLLTADDADARLFREQIRQYNSASSFTAKETNDSNDGAGPWVWKSGYTIYHRVGTLLRIDNINFLGKAPASASLTGSVGERFRFSFSHKTPLTVSLQVLPRRLPPPDSNTNLTCQTLVHLSLPLQTLREAYFTLHLLHSSTWSLPGLTQTWYFLKFYWNNGPSLHPVRSLAVATDVPLLFCNTNLPVLSRAELT
jgi:hypothetical protein